MGQPKYPFLTQSKSLHLRKTPWTASTMQATLLNQGLPNCLSTFFLTWFVMHWQGSHLWCRSLTSPKTFLIAACVEWFAVCSQWSLLHQLGRSNDKLSSKLFSPLQLSTGIWPPIHQHAYPINMKWYDIYLLQMGFYLVAVVSKHVQK